MIQPLRPLRNYIAVHKREMPKDTLIALPDQVKEPVVCGQIVAAGPGKRMPNGRIRPMPVKAGDQVLFRERSAKNWFDPQCPEDYMLITDDDILGVMAA